CYSYRSGSTYIF
nr:immunoglobulin light chain junction region [Macaca mulatta]MPO03030.1 immunoglobulin light chain junction region [Macaca mulatta]MPO03237.1 immunoglobulin light chain junction region [Macaca mulatta]MPO03432.1 immunoglobulin light chain junction region [Macaca mulatta]MPO03450.1 immunoglobulin light chain junction region [Macaca mulatta]